MIYALLMFLIHCFVVKLKTFKFTSSVLFQDKYFVRYIAKGIRVTTTIIQNNHKRIIFKINRI